MIDPLTPPRSTVLPLDPALPPVGDRYQDIINSGDADPDPFVLDAGRPLIFFGLDAKFELRLTKSAAGIEFHY